MLQMKLTKQAVDALRSDGEEIRIWDASVAGSGVRCGSSGKYYFLKYRLPNGRERWATIGRHGSPSTVETARKEGLRLHDPYAYIERLGMPGSARNYCIKNRASNSKEAAEASSRSPRPCIRLM